MEVIQSKDLKVGDYIWVPFLRKLKWFIVKRITPRTVRVSCRIDSTTTHHSYTDYRGQVVSYDNTYQNFISTFENHNVEKYFDLRGRDIILVKREE